MSDDKITLPVAGMTCANCAMNIERAVKKLNGVSAAQVNFAAEQAAIAFDSNQLQVKDVVAKIQGSGFSVPTNKVEFAVTGMACANCSANIERALRKKVPGIVDATVNFASERAAVEYIPGVATLQDMTAAIEAAGYGVISPEEISEEEDAEQIARQAEIREQTRKFIVGVIFALPLFVWSMARDFSLIGMWSHAAWVNWLFWALATPVQFYTGWDYYVNGFKSLKNKSANMDVLVAMGFRITVRMIFHGKFPVGFLYLIIRGRLGNPEHLVVVSFHNIIHAACSVVPLSTCSSADDSMTDSSSSS